MLSVRVLLLRLNKSGTAVNLQGKLNTNAYAHFASIINTRNLHVSTRARTSSTKLTSPHIQQLCLKPQNASLLGLSAFPSAVRFASVVAADEGSSVADAAIQEAPTTTTATTIVDLADIPEAPAIPTSSVQDIATEVLNAAGEPTFASIGLGGWTPVGMVQNCLEYFHIGLDLPWWGAIALGTICVRTIIFPLVILAQRNAAKMNNHMPEMQRLQLKMSEARQSGNALESARYAQEMMTFMKEKDLNPLKNLIVPLAQAPLFISFFMGLRAMANAPVESMRHGGLYWFSDLTVADPTFILPIITSATLYLTIEIGTDSARLSSQNMATMKYVLRALPICIFPFTMNFPAAILTYWACSNFISLGQVAILKIPAVRDYFKIEKLTTHAPGTLPRKDKGFVKGVKDSWQNMQITKEIEERQRLDEIRFAKAGRGPLVKTYKHDPTKPRPTTPSGSTTIEAKSKRQ